MRKFFEIYLNWRVNVLLLLAAAVFVLMVSEADNWVAYAVTKVAGIGLMIAGFRLAKRWKRQGLLRELDGLE